VPERGKRRIHKPPSLREMTACGRWLEAETALLDPEVTVALGASAGKALLGSSFRVSRQRGSLLDRPGASPVLATLHPSAVLRAGDDRDAVYAGVVSDLRVVSRALAG
jgi:DNA polymerase